MENNEAKTNVHFEPNLGEKATTVHANPSAKKMATKVVKVIHHPAETCFNHQNYRYMLFLTNSMLLVISTVLILVGRQLDDVNINYPEFVIDDPVDTRSETVADVFLTTGFLMLVTSTFAFVGAVIPSYCILIQLILLQFVVLVFQIPAAALAGIFNAHVYSVIESRMQESLRRHIVTRNIDTMEMWDNVQIVFKCCGVHNSTDWITWRDVELEINITEEDLTPPRRVIPASCCRSLSRGNCSEQQIFAEHAKGCYEAFRDYVLMHVVALDIFASPNIILQILSIIFTYQLLKGPIPFRQVVVWKRIVKSDSKAQPVWRRQSISTSGLVKPENMQSIPV